MILYQLPTTTTTTALAPQSTQSNLRRSQWRTHPQVQNLLAKSKNSTVLAKSIFLQIFPRRPLHEVSRTAAAEVEPTETSRRSSRRRPSDRTLPPPRSIRYQISVRNLLKSNRGQILENLTLPCHSLPTLSRCTGLRLVFYLLHVMRGEHCVPFLSLLVFVGFCSFVFLELFQGWQQFWWSLDCVFLEPSIKDTALTSQNIDPPLFQPLDPQRQHASLVSIVRTTGRRMHPLSLELALINALQRDLSLKGRDDLVKCGRKPLCSHQYNSQHMILHLRV